MDSFTANNEISSPSSPLVGVQQAILDSLPAHVALIDAKGQILAVNRSWQRFSEENGSNASHNGAGTNYLAVCAAAQGDRSECAIAALRGLEAVLAGETEHFALEYPCHSPQEKRWFRMEARSLVHGGSRGAVVMHVDISQRKAAEEKVERLKLLYQASSQINEAIVRIRNTQELFERACQIAVHGDILLAWIGLLKPGSKCLEPVASWGVPADYLAQAYVSIDEEQPEGRGPGGRAFRSGKPACVNDIEIDSDFALWRDAALSRGFRSAAAFPLTSEGRSIGIVAVYSATPFFFDHEEVRLFETLAANLSFACEQHRQEEERERARAALEASEAMMAAAQSIARFGSWELDFTVAEDDPAALRWSEEMYRIAGLDPRGTPMTRARFYELVHPEDRQAVRKVVAEAIRTRAPYSLVHRMIRPDGSARILQEDARIVFDKESGKPLRMTGTAHDITERKAEERKLKEQAALLDQAQEAILVRDLSHRITYWNKSAERLYGWKAEEVAGRSAIELLHANQEDHLAAYNSVMRQGEWSGEIQKVARDGRRLMIEARWTLVRNEAGEPQSILTVNTDVTERRRQDAQLLRAQRMESIGTLAGGIAHDLNNVFAPIMMSLELLRTNAKGEDLGLLDTLQLSAQRGADLVRQVLSFARGMEGKRVEVNTVNVLREIQKIARDTFPKNVRFELASAPGVWNVIGDPTQLHQVFLNLCVNARDAMPNGGKISVQVENQVLDDTFSAMNTDAHPGPYVVAAFSDTGMGMSSEVVDRIFEPFFTTKEVGKGSGLGLSTSLAIVKSHGGFINVYSEQGKGSKFKVYLPAQTTVAAAEERAVEQTGLPRGRGECVLVVDDEEAIRTITKNTLERYGYRVLLAVNGAEGVSVYARHQAGIALVLTDMSMPVMDGPALIVALKVLNPDVKIIASSGLASNGGVAKAIGAGVQHFAPKPYTAETLLRTIRAVIG